MKRAVIFLNGNRCDNSHLKEFLRSSDFIIAVDGGAKLVFDLGLIPHVVLGDFDSIDSSIKNKISQKNIKGIRFPRRKNETDSELAMQFAIKNGYKEILIVGVAGDRLDHVLGTIFLFICLLQSGINIQILEGNQMLYFTKKSLKINAHIGDLLSLIPLKNDVKNITTKGLEYPLTGEDLIFGKTRGISNVFKQVSVEISFEKGSLLVVHTPKNRLNYSKCLH